MTAATSGWSAARRPSRSCASSGYRRTRGRRGRALRERRAHRHRQEAAAAGEEDQVRPGRHRLIEPSVTRASGTASALVISYQCSSRVVWRVSCSVRDLAGD